MGARRGRQPLPAETVGEHPREVVGADGAAGREQRAALLVVPAHDQRSVRPAMERAAHLVLQERRLVLDHDYLFQSGGELAKIGGSHRVGHTEAHQPHTERAEIALGESEVGEGPLHRGEGRTGREDTEPRSVGREHRAVQTAAACVLPRDVQASREQILFGVEGGGADQRGSWTGRRRRRNTEPEVREAGVNRRGGIRDVGENLEPGPQARRPGQCHRV